MLPGAGRFAQLRGENGLQVAFALQYELEQTEDPERGPWKVSTRKYLFRRDACRWSR